MDPEAKSYRTLGPGEMGLWAMGAVGGVGGGERGGTTESEAKSYGPWGQEPWVHGG